VDDLGQVGRRQLGAHVVDQVGHRAVRERHELLARRRPAPELHVLVEQLPDVRRERDPKVGRQDVPVRDEELFAVKRRLGRDVEQHPDHDLGDRVAVLRQVRLGDAQHVGEE